MQKTILYAVLNWGLGHATRSIPIIKYLIQQNYKLIIASDGEALLLLQKEFPNLIFEETSSYNVVYSNSSSSFNSTLAKQIPKFMNTIKLEQTNCKGLVKKHQVDFIISDNRYGFYHHQIPCALICHQLHLLYESNALVEKIVNKSYQVYLKKFKQLWVPDFASPNSISNKLSILNWNNVQFIGADSRFEKLNLPIQYHVVAVLSGPEPQRSLLEQQLAKELSNTKGNHLLIRGTKNGEKLLEFENIEIIDFATSELLNQKIEESAVIICRSGYTSVIDLLKLQKKALLIPTPGQIEQEYLAKNLKQNNWFAIANQENFGLSKELPNIEKIQSPSLNFGYNFEIIQQFLSYPIYQE